MSTQADKRMMGTREEDSPTPVQPSPALPLTAAPGVQPANLLGAPVPARDIRAGLTEVYALEARQAEESLRRRVEDRRLLEDLAADQFEGPRYDTFANDLAKYGVPVLRGWMHSGHIFRLTAYRGFALHPTEEELDALTRDSDLRDELAIMTVAAALPQFRRRALVDGGWDHQGGASLTTYFMGACTYVFPNEFRRWHVEQTRWRRQNNRDRQTEDRDEHHVTDPATIALGNIRVLDDLGRADDRTQAIVALGLDGYTQAEIVEMLGETSVRAIEGVLYRWRINEQELLRREGKPS